MNRHWALLAALVLTLGLWAMGAGREFSPVDEASHMKAAVSYVQSGFVQYDRWEHPPLKHILLYLDMKIFGDGPYGRRMRNLIFAGLSVLMVYLIGLRLWGAAAGGLAALMLASDPLQMFHSRTTFEEPLAAFFMLAALYFAIRHVRDCKRWAMALSGAFAGMALATKWYYALAIPALLAYCAIALWRRRAGLWAYIEALLSFTLIPLGVYLLAYYAWFGRGYGFWDFARFESDAYWSLQHSETSGFLGPMMHTSLSAWQWFTRPLVYTLVSKDIGGGMDINVVYMNQPVLWMLVLPSMGYMLYRALKGREMELGLIAAVFALTYAVFIPVQRPVFMHSALAVLPLGYLAVGYALGEALAGRSARWRYALCAAVVAMGLYLAPITCGMPVPGWLYAPVVELGRAAMM